MLKMSEFFRYILNLFRSVIRILRNHQPAILHKHNIFIKSNTGSTILLDINPKWDIKNVKEIVALKLGTSPEEMRIILAGKELSDNIMIEECGLGEQSILHAVETRNRQNPVSSSTDWKYEKLLTDNVTGVATPVDANQVERKPYFYVYCASVCRTLQIGKLRVRCDHCKSGAVIVDNDPRAWSDVLNKRKITCICNQNDCDEKEFVKWAEFYFKCSNHISSGADDIIIPLPLVKSNIWNVPCLTCTDVKSPVFVYPCNEKHVTCVDCFVEYAGIRLRDRQFVLDDNIGYTLPCPARCQNSYIDDCSYFKLLTKDQYETYQRFAVEEFVLKSGGVLCPQPDCSAGILTDENCRRIVCQNGCGYVFCRKCLQGYHIGDCDEINLNEGKSGDYSLSPEQAANARWNEASRIVILQSSKPCPQCRTPTEKNGGCMHMVCSRCEFSWCWICQIEWGRDCMSSHWFD